MFAASPKPTLSGHALDAYNDHDTYGDWTTPTDKSTEMAEYQELFKQFPVIADAMDYSNLHADMRSAIWTALYDAEVLGYVDDIADPVNLVTDPYTTSVDKGAWNASTNTPTLSDGSGTKGDGYMVSVAGTTSLDGVSSWAEDDYLYFDDTVWRNLGQIVAVTDSPNVALTRAEAIASYAAKVAHALKLERDQTFPWRITSYSLTELQYLLLADGEVYEYFDTESPTSQWAGFSKSCDHSPKSTYDLVLSETNVATVTTAPMAVAAIMVGLGRQFQHSVSSDPWWILTPSAALVDGISRTGCHHASRLMAHFARAINIPASIRYGYYGAAPHRSTVLPTVNTALVHGDEFYGNGNGYSGIEVLIPYETWLANIEGPYTPIPPGSYDVDLDRASTREPRLDEIKRPAVRTYEDWLNPDRGRAYFEIQYANRLTTPEVTQFFTDMEAYTGSDGIGPKPTSSTAGLTDPGSLETQTGDTHLNTTGPHYNLSVLGTVYCDVPGVTLINCLIDGDGGVGVQVLANGYATLINCEITNCSTGFSGMPGTTGIRACHFHDMTGTAISVTGEMTFSTLYNWTIAFNLIETCGSSIADSYGVTVDDVDTTASTLMIINNTIDVPNSGGYDMDAAVHISAATSSEILIKTNWLNGGVNTLWDASLAKSCFVDSNKFGRDATSFLYGGLSSPNWTNNTYEDDHSEAAWGDSAPL